MDKKVLSNYQEFIPKYFENEFEDSKRVFQTFKSLFNSGGLLVIGICDYYQKYYSDESFRII